MSVIYTNAIVILVAQAVAFFGLPFTPDNVTTIASFIVSVGSAVIIAIRRYSEGDITVGGERV